MVKMYLNPLKGLAEARNQLHGGPVDPNALLEAHGVGGAVRLYDSLVQIQQGDKKATIPISALLKVYLTAPKTHTFMIAGSSMSGGLDSTSFVVEWINEVPKSASITVLKPQRQQFGLMVSAIEQKMYALKTVSTASKATNTTNSVFDELQKLAALRDQGVVTEEEFQEQKKKLLGTQTANQSQKRFDPQTGRPL